jgi:hypothetical protein
MMPDNHEKLLYKGNGMSDEPNEEDGRPLTLELAESISEGTCGV